MIRRLLFTNFRNVYRVSRWMRRRLTPLGTVLAGALVGSAVFGIDTRQTLAFQVAAVLGALFAVAALSALGFRPRLQVRRALPDYTTAGTPATCTVYLRNAGRRVERELVLADELEAPLPDFSEFIAAARRDTHNWFDRFVGYPRWLDMVQRRRGASLEQAAVPPIPPGEEVAVRVALRPTRRGYIEFRGVYLLRPDPLGVMNAVRRYHCPASLLVLPRRYPAPAIHRTGRRRYQPGGERLATSVGDSQEFASLREYRPGDPLRHIHWRTWARVGHPVVKEFQDEFFDRNALVLDTFPPTADEAQFEEAVSIAASFACADWGPDALLDLLLAAPGTVRLTAGRGLADPGKLLEALACVQATPGGDFQALTRVVDAAAARLGTIVCVLLALDAPRSSLLRRLSARGVDTRVVLVTREGEDAPPAPAAAGATTLVTVAPGEGGTAIASLGSAPGRAA